MKWRFSSMMIAVSLLLVIGVAINASYFAFYQTPIGIVIFLSDAALWCTCVYKLRVEENRFELISRDERHLDTLIKNVAHSDDFRTDEVIANMIIDRTRDYQDNLSLLLIVIFIAMTAFLVIPSIANL
jgi:hypothetical protein